MTTPSNQGSLIEELEARQNDVLDRLADLNSRVEGLLNECLAARDARLKDEQAGGPAVVPPPNTDLATPSVSPAPTD